MTTFDTGAVDLTILTCLRCKQIAGADPLMIQARCHSHMAALCQACIPACGCEYTLDEKGSKERSHEYGISELVGNVEMYDVVYAETDADGSGDDDVNEYDHGHRHGHGHGYEYENEYEYEYDDDDDDEVCRHVTKRNATTHRMKQKKFDIHM